MPVSCMTNSAAGPTSSRTSVAWTSSRPRSLRRAIPGCHSSSASGGTGAGCERRRVKPVKRPGSLTIPDFVLLSLLAERPMHGYQANVELERRQVRDWAGISRPQVYYSLDKLVRLRLLRRMQNREPAAGPERYVFATTAAGRRTLADALDGEE